MQIVEIKPSNKIKFIIPDHVASKFSIGNLALHPVCIYIVCLHPQIISVSPICALVEAFQDLQVNVIAHSILGMNELLKTKIRIYIWQSYDDIELNEIKSIMFNKETEGNCLIFDEITISFSLSENLIAISQQYCKYYFVRQLALPNNNQIQVTEEITQRLMSTCEKMGKIKGIYTYATQYVLHFDNARDVNGCFIEIRDNKDNLVLFAVGSQNTFGRVYQHPNFIALANQEYPVDQNANKISGKIKHINTVNIGTSQYNARSKIPDTIKKSINNKIKQSFLIANQSNFSHKIYRKRTKSQQNVRFSFIDQDQEQESQSSFEQSNNLRNAINFSMKTKPQFIQSVLEVNKKILNIKITSNGQQIILLLRDSLLICKAGDFSDKWIIKFDPIDQENIHLPTPMLIHHQTAIFGNQSYLFWVNLMGKSCTWKYVQRKQIYCLQIIEQLNLLAVGGKTFSKLSYLGKSTHRTNIKIYSAGTTAKYDHLFTYDVSQCNGDSVMHLKYVKTKPSGVKLLLVLTNFGRILFLRVRAFNEFEVYSCLDTHQIGIQEIVDVQAHAGYIIFLERLDNNFLCFKNIKINCSYEKVQISTQSIRLPVTGYKPYFIINTTDSRQWISVCETNGDVWVFYLDSNSGQKIQTRKDIKYCIAVSKGYIFQENTGIRSKLIKQSK